MHNQAAATAFAEWQRAKRGAPASTLEKYRRLALGWADFLPTPLAERTPEDVEAFYGRPRRGGGEAAPATVANELAGFSEIKGNIPVWVAREEPPISDNTIPVRPFLST